MGAMLKKYSTALRALLAEMKLGFLRLQAHHRGLI